MPESLASISDRYGQSSKFGRADYDAAKAAGYSNREIINWLNQNLTRLNQSNQPAMYGGSTSGLYEQILRNFEPSASTSESAGTTSRPSLESISRRYGQYETFGHKDYEAAKTAGYSDSKIKSWLDQDLNRLHPNNRSGGISGLYDEISSGSVDLTKAVNIDRGAPSSTTDEGMTPFEYDYQKSIDLANINKQIESMRNQSNQYIADVQARSAGNVATISAGATKYTADKQKEATTYVADREKETALGVEDIRAKGALDLQNIVNAGLKDVETLRGESAENVATIGGEFAVEVEEEKGKTARDVARIDRDKGIYGSLISAFQF